MYFEFDSDIDEAFRPNEASRLFSRKRIEQSKTNRRERVSNPQYIEVVNDLGYEC
jgi:hypothetical protein